MDSVSSFFQCSIHEDAIPKTTACTQSGDWKRTVMPLGLAPSPGWFQPLSAWARRWNAFGRLLTTSRVSRLTVQAHVRDLVRFLERLSKFDLKLAPKKAPLEVRVMKFLGHRVAADGLASDSGKVEALNMGCLRQRNFSQLRLLCGALSYCRKFLPRIAAAKIKPPNALLGKDVKFVFSWRSTLLFVQELLKRLPGEP